MHKHESEYLATQEAVRLASAHPGQVFVVLEAKTARIAGGMVNVAFDPDQEIPF
jgi:hypothetical protein